MDGGILTYRLLSICILEIRVNEHLIYKLKIYSVTGDCPALRMILDFIGHGGYFCCWYCYLRGQHINGKRQYKHEEPMIIRTADAYSMNHVWPNKARRMCSVI